MPESTTPDLPMRDDDRAPRSPISRRGAGWLGACMLGGLLAAGLAGYVQQTARAVAKPSLSAAPVAFHPALVRDGRPGTPALALHTAEVPVPLAIERGQTLGGLLGALGLDPLEVIAAVDALDDNFDVRKLRPGATCMAYFDEAAPAADGFGPGARETALAALRLRRDDAGWVTLRRTDDGWSSNLEAFQREIRVARVAGTLTGGLEGDVRRAGGHAAVAYRMADVLQWDLDFNRDLRLGDSFAVVYENLLLDGSDAGPRDVLAMVYENRGVRYEAYRHGESGGYYDADGRPLQKMFLKSPLPFSRITSRFSKRRFHPVLKVNRPHYGVDYGAPVGTPVRVTASGTVTHVGRKGGAGKMIKVRHANGYLTAYLHLSRYAKGLRRGARVRQGDVIGYVGSTGWSTGPHLDYRVQRKGTWIDPLSLKQVPADPIPAHDLPAFLAQRDRLRAQLEGHQPLDAPRDTVLAGDPTGAGDAAAPAATATTR
ncbi:MAG: peptidoglycan DD-metalloendopeptidase family protein [Acidobacteriota bacterium]